MMKLSLIKKIIIVLILPTLYYYSPYKPTFLGYYQSKIGAHKCNSIHKLKSASLFFKTIELDLHYTDNNTFDIYHSDDVSNGLSLAEYLANIKSIKDCFLWLDIKNLKPNNSAEILNKLNKLVLKYGLNKNQLLIETRYPLALPIFSKNNYRCSYYITSKLYQLDDYELKKNISKIKFILDQQSKIGISFDYTNYDILNVNFPKKNKYTWNISRFPLKNLFKTRNILNDEKVKIMLTTLNTFKN